MRSNVVVIGSPGVDDLASFGQRSEGMLVETLVSQTAVEGFNVAILCWPSRIDEMQLDLPLRSPVQHVAAGKLGPVVRDNHSWIASFLGALVKRSCHAQRWNRIVDFDSDALSGEGVEHAQPAKRPRPDRVADEVDGPDFVAPGRLGPFKAASDRNASLFASANLKLCCAIDSVNPFVVGDDANLGAGRSRGVDTRTDVVSQRVPQAA